MATSDKMPARRGGAASAGKPAGAGARDKKATEPPSLIAVMEHRSESHRGPLPRPETFAAYDQVLPGAADRILTMAERAQANAEATSQREQQHRHELEKLQLTLSVEIERSEIEGTALGVRRGQYLSFATTNSCLIAVVVLMLNGVTGAALAPILVAIAGLAGLTLYNNKKGRDAMRELQEDARREPDDLPTGDAPPGRGQLPPAP
jgi:uncharacterized membrane protein